MSLGVAERNRIAWHTHVKRILDVRSLRGSCSEVSHFSSLRISLTIRYTIRNIYIFAKFTLLHNPSLPYIYLYYISQSNNFLLFVFYSLFFVLRSLSLNLYLLRLLSSLRLSSSLRFSSSLQLLYSLRLSYLSRFLSFYAYYELSYLDLR